MDRLKDTLARFQPAGWSAENLKTGETITLLYCLREPPHGEPAEALHTCPAHGDSKEFLCSCCGVHQCQVPALDEDDYLCQEDIDRAEYVSRED